MLNKLREKIKNEVENKYNITGVTVEEPKKGNADLAIPLFKIIKETSKTSNDLFTEISDMLMNDELIDKTEFLSGFLNIYLNREKLSFTILMQVNKEGSGYGSKVLEKPSIVVIDYSSPNIAKNFSVGHLRSTVIGNALKNIYQKMGHEVIDINHLGDWGTQFGKMIVAYKKWGNKEDVIKNPIIELQKLYVRFHEEAKNDESLEDEGRIAFMKLEQGDKEYSELWQWFREESIKEFMKMYEMLKVRFNSYNGEAFYNDKMADIIKELKEKKLLISDQGANIVSLGDDIPPALIQRSDGATLYMTRDLAALFYRYKTYHFDKALYVVGNEQKLHFDQLKRITDKMGYNFDITHVNFGLVLVNGKKMSTREGKFARLDEVIEEAIEYAKKAILDKNPNLENKDEVAKAVGIGAIIFNDLKNERTLDVDFNLESMLKFEGQTGPYLQYSSVRINSITKLKKLDINNILISKYNEDHYFELIKLIGQFPNIVEKAKSTNSPNIISRYLLNLAQAFNHFYAIERIITDEENIQNSNLLLVNSIKTILNEGLRLLGITVLEEM